MFMARVKGNVIAPARHPSLRGRLLIIQPMDPIGRRETGIAQVAVDTLGAGMNSVVLATSDGRIVQEMLKTTDDCPARLAVVAIVDAADSSVVPVAHAAGVK